MSAILKTYQANLQNIINNWDAITDNAITDNSEHFENMNSAQLFEGKLSTGGSLPSYAESTKKHKVRTGQITSPMILNDVPGSNRGPFHKNIFTEYEGDVLKMSSDTDYTRYLVDRFSPDIFGVTTQNRQRISKRYILPDLVKTIKQQLKK